MDDATRDGPRDGALYGKAADGDDEREARADVVVPNSRTTAIFSSAGAILDAMRDEIDSAERER